MNSKYPLFSFLIICYNQEKYIKDALESALEQEYPNLEIIISDDNSTDNTFQIAKEISENYQGKHKLILNCNEQNLGIGANFYKAFTLSSGEWLFMAAGDDISYPNRASEIYQIINRHQNCFGIDTAREVIDGDGKSHGFLYWNESMLGASSAWNRKVFTKFPPIGKEIMSEDLLLQFRALLLGNIIKTNAILLKYRIDGNSVSKPKVQNMLEKKEIELKKKKYYYSILENRINDLNYANHCSNLENYNAILECLESKKRFTEIKIKEYSSSLQTLSSNLLETICYIFKSNNPPHDKLVYRLYLSMSKFKLFNSFYKKNISNVNKFDDFKNEIIETVQNIDDYIILPIEIL
jgi:glycosyltransferase involved in cell wall biosynthesis